ncbi:MAG: aldehyde dehydrogenase family protein [Chitinophagales bacterium]
MTETKNIGQSVNDSLEKIQTTFQLQKNNLLSIRKTSIKDRKKKLKALKAALFAHRENLQNAIYADFKKPAIETDITEINSTLTELKHTIAHLSEWARDEYVDTTLTLLGSSSYIQYEPKGNTLIITPWNYPIYLSLSPIISAVAAGNAVILKPSEFTPNTNKAIKKLLFEIFEEKELAVIEGDYTVSSELLKLKFNHIHFTGSPAVGKIIMREAANHLASCTLELGGKSPTIVDESANLKDAASKIVWGKYINEGQTCIAPDYVLVHKNIQEKFIAQLKQTLQERFGADAEKIKSSAFLARIVNTKHFGRIKTLLNEAVSNEANVEFGGDFDENDNYISPTLVSNVSKDDEIMQEEIFGPILPLIPFDNIEDAIAKINDKEKPLALYVFSKKSKNINKVLQETSSGGVCINDTLLHILNPNLPFGGVNNSGIGKSHGIWGFKDFSNERGILKQHLPFSAAKLLYPPYTKMSKFLIDFTMKWL